VFALLLAMALALGALAVWVRFLQAEPGLVRGVPQPVPLAMDNSFGFNTDLSAYDAQTRDSVLASMQVAGAKWVRQRFPWDRIEAKKGFYDWEVWDQLVDDVAQGGLQLVAVLDGAPEWARAAEDAGNRLAPPVEARDFGGFAQAFAQRYGDQIDFYQIWDEPNIAPHWGKREVNPAGYAHLLRDAAIQIRAVDPSAIILLAALAPNVEPGGANMSELLFLDALYGAGAGEWIDVVGGQPYDFDAPADAAADPGQLNWKRLGLLREVMESHDDHGTGLPLLA
jgi:hypothetical protein